MAIDSRRPSRGALIQSDDDAQFTSWAFTPRALDSGPVASMGFIADCFDNAVVDSFWARMQGELLDRRRWRTRVGLANAIFEYIEILRIEGVVTALLGSLTDGVREDAHLSVRRGMKSSESTPRNPRNIRASKKLGPDHVPRVGLSVRDTDDLPPVVRVAGSTQLGRQQRAH